MSFFSQDLKSTLSKVIIVIMVLIAIATFVVIGLGFVDSTETLRNLTLFLASLILLFALVFTNTLKQQFKNDLTLKKLRNSILELELKLKESEGFSSYQSIYLANISHEIKTPLNTVFGMLNMLKQTNLDDDQTAQVEIAEHSSQHLLQLVNMILDNTRADNDEIELNLEATNIEEDLSKLFKIFEYQAWDKDLSFDYEFLSKEKQKFYVLADSSRIQQVLINLINNAIKFTHSGKISVIVDQTVTIDDDQIATFYIKDTGVGMRSYEVKQIFNKEKPELSSLQDYRGSGIGLSISRQLVKLMGGELKIESKENEGTTFYFSLPLKKTLNIKGKPEIRVPIIQKKFNVLVAEDNRMNQKVIKFLLEQQGVDCTFAKNGLEALELYKILDFDMVFMDIYMPDMNGLEATRKIRRTKKFTEHKTPIIAVSASAFEDDINSAKLSGIDDFLAKPIDVEKLKDLLLKYAPNGSEV